MPKLLPYYEPHDERMKDCPFLIMLQMTSGDAIGDPVHVSYAKIVDDYESVGLAIADCMFNVEDDGFYGDEEVGTVDRLLTALSDQEGWIGNGMDGMPLLRSWRVSDPTEDVSVDGLLICLAHGIEYEQTEEEAASSALIDALAGIGLSAIEHAGDSANIAFTASVSPEVFGAFVGEMLTCDRSVMTRLSDGGSDQALFPDFQIASGSGDEIVTATVTYLLRENDSAAKLLSMWDNFTRFAVHRDEGVLRLTVTAKHAEITTVLDYTYEDFIGIAMEVTDPDEAL